MSEHTWEAAGASGAKAAPLFPAALEHQWAVRLVTYRHDGTPVSTPVSIVADGDRAYFRTYDRSGKAARLRHSRRVAVAPSDWRGRATGPAFAATARLLDGPQAARAAQLIDRKYPWFQRVLVRLGHRLRRYRTLHFELTAEGQDERCRPDACR